MTFRMVLFWLASFFVGFFVGQAIRMELHIGSNQQSVSKIQLVYRNKHPSTGFILAQGYCRKAPR